MPINKPRKVIRLDKVAEIKKIQKKPQLSDSQKKQLQNLVALLKGKQQYKFPIQKPTMDIPKPIIKEFPKPIKSPEIKISAPQSQPKQNIKAQQSIPKQQFKLKEINVQKPLAKPIKIKDSAKYQLLLRFRKISNLKKSQINSFPEPKLLSLQNYCKETTNQIKQYIQKLNQNHQPIPIKLGEQLAINNQIIDYVEKISSFRAEQQQKEIILEATNNRPVNSGETKKIKPSQPKPEVVETERFTQEDLERIKKTQNDLKRCGVTINNKEILLEITKQFGEVESGYKADFLVYGVAKVLKYKPTLKIMQEITKQLKKVEPNHRSDFLKYGVAKVLEYNPTPEIMQEITKQLKKVESAQKEDFLEFGVVRVLEYKPTLKIMQEITKQLEKVEPNHRYDFLEYGVAKVLEYNPTLEIMQEITKQLEKVHSAQKEDFLQYGVVRVLEYNPTLEIMQEITKLLEKVHSAKRYFLQYGVAKVLEYKPTLEEFKVYMQEITKLLEKVEPNHRYDFLKYGVAKVLEYNPTLEIMQEITKLLEKVEPNHRYDFLKYGVAKVLEYKPTLEEFKVYMQEIIKQWEKVEPNLRYDFLKYAVPVVLKYNPTPEIMQEIIKQWEKVEPNLRYDFLKYAVPVVLKYKPTLKIMQEIIKQWEKVEPNHRYAFLKYKRYDLSKFYVSDLNNLKTQLSSGKLTDATNTLKFLKNRTSLLSILNKLSDLDISLNWQIFKDSGYELSELPEQRVPISLAYKLFNLDINQLKNDCKYPISEIYSFSNNRQSNSTNSRGWVPEEFRVENYYDILGISQDATLDDIRRARKIIALKAHPDKGGDPKTMSKINEIVEILLNPLKRKEYDKKLKGYL